VMGQASSPVEANYAARLADLADIEFGTGYQAGGPIAVTSLLEGFGLPFIETAVARRPFVGRYLPNATPDIRRAGCALPLIYREIRVPRDCLDFAAEKKRRRELFRQWRERLPAAVRGGPDDFRLPANGLPFSRLTLTGQLEVMANRPDWESAQRWNPALRTAAGTGTIPRAELTDAGKTFFSPETYARHFWQGIARARGGSDGRAAFSALLAQKMAADNRYPLLMAEIT